MKNTKYRGILADLDGTLYRGRTLVPGAKELYQDFVEQGIQWMFLSNNAARVAPEIANRIRELGLDVSDRQVVNSATALTHAISREYRGSRVLALGQPSLVRGIEQAGAVVVEDPVQAEIVVTALDTGITYEKIKRAHLALQNGALFWATNMDATFPVENGFHPGAGTIVAAVATAAGRQPDRVFGKPSPDMAILALDVLGLPRDSCLIVGDRMETDILFAKNTGIRSVLVLTGATSTEDLPKHSYSPDFILDSIADLRQLMD
jgi:4-nitrophenyl phosphatase